MDSESTIKPGKYNRRSFLGSLWRLLGVVVAAEMAWLTLNMLTGKAKGARKAGDKSKMLKLGHVNDFSKNSVTPFRASKLYLVRQVDGGFLALSLSCPHLGCSVIWEVQKDGFVCPCHSSTFDKTGNAMSSPAPRALDYYPVVIEDGKVMVDMNQKRRRKRFHKNQLAYA